MKRVWCVIVVLMMIGGVMADSFEADNAAWRVKREAALRKADGWLTLAGLFWLDADGGTFGSDESCRYRFPAGAPPVIGTFRLVDGKVAVDFQDGRREMLDPKVPEGEKPMTLGRFSWYVIEREGRVGIRLKDRESPARAAFHGLQYYPADARWRVTGHFSPYQPPHQRKAPSALGVDVTVDVLGKVTFEADGKPQQLEVYADAGDPEWSIIFGDATNHHGTYPSGRYLDVKPAAANGDIVIDFNRAYNPPCAFTPYATCTYPPKENRLSIAVEAGEKFSGH